MLLGKGKSCLEGRSNSNRGSYDWEWFHLLDRCVTGPLQKRKFRGCWQFWRHHNLLKQEFSNETMYRQT